MKKTLILFGIITLFLNSCGSKAANLDVNKLEDPCDFVEAYIDNLEAQIELLEKNEGLEKIRISEKTLLLKGEGGGGLIRSLALYSFEPLCI